MRKRRDWLPGVDLAVEDPGVKMAAKELVRTETLGLIDWLGNPVYTDGHGCQVVVEVIGGERAPIEDALLGAGLVRGECVVEYYADGSHWRVSDNINTAGEHDV